MWVTSASTAAGLRPRRPELDVAAVDIDHVGMHGSRLPRTPRGDPRRARPAGALQRLQRSRRQLSHSLWRLRRTRSAGSRGLQRSVRALRADGGREADRHASDQEPGGGERGAPDARDGDPPVLVIALNDAIADGRDVSWIWDIDLEPILPHVAHVVVSGERSPSSGFGSSTGVCRKRGSRSSRAWAALDRGWSWSKPAPSSSSSHVHRDARAPRRPRRARPRPPVLDQESPARIRIGHLYPEYLNIYADRGNIAVLARAPPSEGTSPHVEPIGLGGTRSWTGSRPPLRRRWPGSRAVPRRPDLAAKGDAIREAVAGGGAPRRLRRLPAPRAGLPRARRLLHCPEPGSSRTRPSPDTRMIGDVLLECEVTPGCNTRSRVSRTKPGAPVLDPGAALGRVVHGFGNDGASGFEGCRVECAVGTYLHGPLPPEPLARGLAPRGRRSHTPAGRRASHPRTAPGRARGEAFGCPRAAHAPAEGRG